MNCDVDSRLYTMDLLSVLLLLEFLNIVCVCKIGVFFLLFAAMESST